MSAAAALRAAWGAGVRIRVDGDELVLDADSQPPASIIEDLSRHKPDYVRRAEEFKDHAGSGLL